MSPHVVARRSRGAVRWRSLNRVELPIPILENQLMVREMMGSLGSITASSSSRTA